MRQGKNSQQHLTVQQLRYLLKTLEAGSVTESAKQLGISQSTLSEAISQAESLTGFTVISRSRKGVTATEKGRFFLNQAQRVVDEMDRLENDFLSSRRKKERLSVSSLSFGFAWESLVTLSKQPESADLDIIWHLDIASQVAERVKNGEADLGLLNLMPGKDRPIRKMIEDSDLEFHPLLESKLYAIMDPSHPLAGKTSASIEDLSEWPQFEFDQFVHSELLTGLNGRGDIISYPQSNDQLAHDNGIKTPTGAIISPVKLVRNIADSYGYTVWSKFLPESFARDQVVGVPIETDDVMVIGYVMNRGSKLSEPAERFVQIMKQFKGNPGEYSAEDVARALGVTS